MKRRDAALAIGSIEQELARVESKIAMHRAKLDGLEQRKKKLEFRREDERRRHGVFGKLTKKNTRLYEAWAAVDRKLVESNPHGGASTAALLEAVQVETLSVVKPVTFRSYLVRFRDEGLIEKHGSNWRFRIDTRRDKPSSFYERNRTS